ncbi:proline-rich protein HaeIII subfamily 1-like [Homarus americanus]|uniref:proline-rich protein HaeIII subfamily 1-like n=1 Tax=Homarus americanus TaxID=6706 RepID=UPI001C46B4AD|nr:proline-rich protein HaeIII subfamily 1-like [Homarus americanus]
MGGVTHRDPAMSGGAPKCSLKDGSIPRRPARVSGAPRDSPRDGGASTDSPRGPASGGACTARWRHQGSTMNSDARRSPPSDGGATTALPRAEAPPGLSQGQRCPRAPLKNSDDPSGLAMGGGALLKRGVQRSPGALPGGGATRALQGRQRLHGPSQGQRPPGRARALVPPGDQGGQSFQWPCKVVTPQPARALASPGLYHEQRCRSPPSDDGAQQPCHGPWRPQGLSGTAEARGAPKMTTTLVALPWKVTPPQQRLQGLSQVLPGGDASRAMSRAMAPLRTLSRVVMPSGPLPETLAPQAQDGRTPSASQVQR